MTETTTLDIPIVAYPPFKLRSSLIDKDPVIWVHLIEFYIKLFQRLIKVYNDRSIKLSLKSQQQLSIFLKIYLHETLEETTKIFSLGSINPDIVKNSKVLKLYIFEFIKLTNLVNLQLSGESIWDFVKIYGKLAQMNLNNKNFPVTISIVRQLVEGSIKSKINSRSNDLSSIPALHNHIKSSIEGGKFQKHDLEALEILLGKYVQKSQSNDVRRINNSKSKNKKQATPATPSSLFAEEFVTGSWLETLEVLYNKGTTVHAKTTFEVGVITVLSLPVIKLSKLISVDLSINSFKAFIRLFPLLATIVLSKNYSKITPGLEERLPFLSKEGRKTSAIVVFDESQISAIRDLFPQITESQAKRLLVDYDFNVETIINKLLEMGPSSFSDLKDYNEYKRSVYDGDEFSQPKPDNSKILFGKKERTKKFESSGGDLKKKTLTAALRLLYESDEDEPDDTYDDQELTVGEVKPSRSGTPAPVDFMSESRDLTPPVASVLEQTENTLFAIYKKNPEVLDRSARKTKARQELKQNTKWSDEQIEGWARMLVKQPSKYRLLDEKYTFGSVSTNNRSLKQATSYRKPQQSEPEDEELELVELIKERQSIHQRNRINTSTGSGNPQSDKLKKLRDQKKKLSRANHNRKSGHDKKMAKGFA